MNEYKNYFKDNCGFGLLANIDNKATHTNVEDAVTALEKMMHRGAVAADGKSGDGSGLLFGMPKSFMRKVAIQNGPIDTKALGEFALKSLPEIVQIFVKPNSISATRRFALSMYIARREIEKRMATVETCTTF